MKTEYKYGKWAKEIVCSQHDNGSWGQFHSLKSTGPFKYTTEMALRRLWILGYTKEDLPVQNALQYMKGCLETGEIPDPREKSHNWDAFVALIVSTWIRMFESGYEPANRIAEQWKRVMNKTFAGERYDHEAYLKAQQVEFHEKPRGGRFVDFVSFYPVALLAGCLEQDIERKYIDYILHHKEGMYYIYDKPLDQPPEWGTKAASWYLWAMELLLRYETAGEQLGYVREWLLENQLEDGRWDLSQKANDKILLPYSDSWRKAETRISDCTERVRRAIEKIGG